MEDCCTVIGPENSYTRIIKDIIGNKALNIFAVQSLEELSEENFYGTVIHYPFAFDEDYKVDLDREIQIVEDAARHSKKYIFLSTTKTATASVFPLNKDTDYRRTALEEDGFELRRDKPRSLLDPRKVDPGTDKAEKAVRLEKTVRKNTGEREGFNSGIVLRTGYLSNKDPSKIEKLENRSSYLSSSYFRNTICRCFENDHSGFKKIFCVSDTRYRIFNIETPFL